MPGQPLFDHQPNSVVQGLDILEQFQHGSVSATSRQLLWGEIDYVAPGVTSDSGLVFGRRYFSDLTHDGRGSTGVRWISSITERLMQRTASDGKSALQHLSWLQPFNDPDYYYVATEEGSNTFVAGVQVGATITKSGGEYLLTFKNGSIHKFSTFADGEIRVVYRKDPFGNAITFAYDDPIQGGYAVSRHQTTNPEEALLGTVITITDSRGVTYTVNLDLAGYIVSIVGPMGFTILFEYEWVGGYAYLVKVVYPTREILEPNGALVNRTSKREFFYDTNGRLGEVRDDYGATVLHNTYDPFSLGQIATQTDADGGTYTFTSSWSGSTLTNEVMTPRGWKRVYLHNGQGLVTAIRQYQANFAGAPARTGDANLYYEWLFGRSHACQCGPVTSITEPDGGHIELTYSSALDLTEVRKRSPDLSEELIWRWTYDSEHRVATHIPPEGNAATDPTPYTVTYNRTYVGTNLVTTTTIPPRDGRIAPSVWTETSDGQGRIFEMVGPPHSGANPSFGGKWTFYTQGDGNGLPYQAYQFDSSTIAYTYVWDQLGRLTTIADAAQHSWACSYDLEGRPLELTAPTVNQVQTYKHKWFYDGNGRLVRIQWRYYADDADTVADWIEWNFTYDAAGQMLTRTKQLDSASPTPAVATEAWSYDLEGNVIAATDADGYVTTVLYDERDLPWILTDGVGTTEETAKAYDYNSDGRLSVITEQLDATRQVRFENEYDGLDRLFRYHIKDAGNPSTVAGYVETSYESGSRIQAITTYAVSGGTPIVVDKKTFAYEDFHACPTRQTSFVYDLATGFPLRSVQSDFDYGPSGRPLREWVGGTTLVASYTYLPCGLPDEISDAHGNSMLVLWDAYARVLAEVNTYHDDTGGQPLVMARTYLRDEFGRATRITDTGNGVADQSHDFVYDSCDNVVHRKGPDGSVQVYQFRYDGLVTREDAVIAGATVRAQQVIYTPGGRRQQVIDDRNNSVSFIYDGRGRLKQEVYPDGTTWTNQQNQAGLLTKITGPSGRTVDFSYDWRGMVAQTVYKDGLGAVKRTDVFDVDLGGFIKRVTRTENGITHYVDMANDSTGRILTETTEIPGLPQATVQFLYDNLGRLQTITSPYGYEHTYTYDDRNRVKEVWLAHGNEGNWGQGNWNVANYDYLGTGPSVMRRITGDGYTLNVTRDGFGRITRMQTPGIADFQYGYDGGNRVSQEFRALDGKGDAFWYDGLGRLTKTTKDSVNPAAELSAPQSTTHSFHREFLMDGDSHRTQVKNTPMGGAVELTNYSTHGTRHEYTQIQKVGQPAVSRSFDLDGRLTNQGSRSFTYDISDNLIRVDEGGMVGEYTYDALGRRVTKFDGQGYETRYVYAGPWVLEDYRRIKFVTPWNLKGAYVHGPGIDNVVMMRHRDWVDADSDWDKVEPRNFYLHANKQGSTTEVVDQDGAIVERYRYEEYGKPTVLDANGNVLSAAVCGNSFLFTGREYDWETGLYHYRARAYDPATGTFLQEDPLGMRDGINVVAYVHANPVNLSDPFGTDGIGEMVDNIMNFISENRALVADLIISLMGPLEGILDLMSAATGKDITGWLKGGGAGEPEAMGWWGRATAAASAAITLAAGALKLIPKLKSIFKKIEEVVERAKEAISAGARKGICPLTGGCFLAGTLVAMADRSFVPIEDVDTGQLVQCEQPAAMPGMAGEEMIRAVTSAGGRVYEGAIVTVVIEAGGKTARVSGTPEHPFWSVNRQQWVPMGELVVGGRLDGADGDVAVVGREVAFARVTVFNCGVDGAHSYRVSELGVLVHNGGPCDLRVLSKHELKNIDEHALKEAFVENPNRFNIAKGGDGKISLVPVKRGAAPNHATNLTIEQAAAQYPAR